MVKEFIGYQPIFVIVMRTILYKAEWIVQGADFAAANGAIVTAEFALNGTREPKTAGIGYC
jgi:hypothetical protein